MVAMAISVTISKLQFNDGTEVELGDDDILVIVGPNNSGKSQSLRDIQQRVSGENPTKVVTGSSLRKVGTTEELETWIDARIKNRDTADPSAVGLGTTIPSSTARTRWAEPDKLRNLAPFFSVLVDTANRLGIVQPPNSINPLTDTPNHPFHLLYGNDDLLKLVSDKFREAFGTDLTLNYAAGNTLPLHVGVAPSRTPADDRVSTAYLELLRSLPLLHEQGDGMRSFVGSLLHALIGDRSIVLLDEPEAFLHPPQARMLGSMLATNKPSGRQLVIATHSGDLLHGLLDSGKPIQVIRLTREGNVNSASILKSADVAVLWNDPLFRFSNILDGLFHEQVVVCEADADCRFYAAVNDKAPQSSTHYSETMFTYGSGKDRIATIVRSLKSLNVPVDAILDFDVLSAERPLKDIVEALGGVWSEVAGYWSTVKDSVERSTPELDANLLKEQVTESLASANDAVSLSRVADHIKSTLRASRPWANTKRSGLSGLESGAVFDAAQNLLEKLAVLGLHVVPCGELEQFVPSIPHHGPAWVIEAVKRDLSTDLELQAARQFVKTVTNKN